MTSTKITPVLEKLRGSREMRVMCINKTFTDDDDARIFATMPKLYSLELAATHITDAAIELLPTTLIELNVQLCKLTPACIDSFKRHKNLRHLQITKNGFSDSDLRRLKQVLPLAQIDLDFSFSKNGDSK